MKIFAFTDLHSNLEFLEKHIKLIKEADIILSSGDFVGYLADKKETKIVFNLITNFFKQYNFYFIWGNVDIMLAKKYNIDLTSYENIKNKNNLKMHINNQNIFINNINISGLDFNAKAKDLVFNSDILITHEPPFNTKIDLTLTNQHIGNKLYKEKVKQSNIKYWFCGHVHESKGEININNTKVINIGPALKDNLLFLDF